MNTSESNELNGEEAPEDRPQAGSETPPLPEEQPSPSQPKTSQIPRGEPLYQFTETSSQSSDQGPNPGKKLRDFEKAAKKTKPPKLPLRYRLRPDRQKVRHAFWDVAGGLSMIVNVILIAALILLSREFFSLKRMVVGNLLGGLYLNFGKMDTAHITTTIQVQTEIEVDFPLQINQPTQVTLTEDTPVSRARVTLTTGGLNILSAPTNIILPSGTTLPILLNMTVPVKTTVPVSIPVEVDIPLSGTELHEPFSNLQEVIGPYLFTFWGGPYYWEDVAACKVLRPLCAWWFK